MKYWNSFIICLVALLSSCSDKDYFNDVTPESGAVAFASSNSSRAGVTNADKLSEFGVLAYHDGNKAFDSSSKTPNFMYNQKVTKSGSAWSYSPLKYWPADPHKVSFFAYAPYSTSANNSNTEYSAITELSANNYAGDPYLKFRSGSNQSNQTDLVYAASTDVSSSDGPVGLTFKHALARYRISVNVTGSDEYDYSLVSYKLKKVTLSASGDESSIPCAGTLNLKTGAWSQLIFQNTDYVLFDEPSGSSLNFGGTVITGQDTSATDFFFAIPTQNDASVTFAVEYDIIEDGNTMPITASKEVALANRCGDAYELKIGINLDEITLEANSPSAVQENFHINGTAPFSATSTGNSIVSITNNTDGTDVLNRPYTFDGADFTIPCEYINWGKVVKGAAYTINEKNLAGEVATSSVKLTYGYKFSYTINPTSASTINLPWSSFGYGGIAYTTLAVVYGDDNTSVEFTSFTPEIKSHSYQNGTYIVSVLFLDEDINKTRGAFERFPTCLTSINSCLPLSSNEFDHTFQDCSILSSIPEDLFRYNTRAKVFNYTFKNCSSLSSIPEDLFRYNTSAEDFSYVFQGCSSLSSIPVDLFRYNTSAEDFSYAFNGCSSLSSIPEDLFRYNTRAKKFSATFMGCSSLSSIPSGLFRNTWARYFIGTFMGCSSLSSIPEDLFINTNADNFMDTFKNCSSLSSIPVNLFRYDTSATNFSATFEGCSSLSSIPEDLFRYNTKARLFSYAFYGCSSLSSIPVDLFRYNTKATDFHFTFRDCDNLSYIPSGLFIYNTEVTDFYGTFFGCTKVTSNVPALWNSSIWPNVTDYNFCFAACINAANYSDIPSGWK